MPVQNVVIRAMGIGHVGIHFQPGLPPVLQEIFDRHAQAQVEHRDRRLMKAAMAMPPGPVASKRSAALAAPGLERISRVYIAASSRICPPARLGALSCWKLSLCSSAS
jgi:hypothetical protein